MNEPEPSAGPPPNKQPPVVAIALAALVVIGLIGVFLLRGSEPETERPGEPPPQDAANSAGGLPNFGAPKALAVPSAPVLMPTYVLDVFEPKSVFEALRKDPALGAVLDSPLGRGWVGAWGGFFGSRGQDLKASFQGTVLELLLDRVFSRPVRVTWLGAQGRDASPVLRVANLDAAARAAIRALDQVARRGVFRADRCPGEEAARPAPIEILRWVIADRAVYVAESESAWVLGRFPNAVLHGLCQPEPPPNEKPDAIALELSVVTKNLGRGAQGLGNLIGSSKPPRLQFTLTGGKLTPHGLALDLDGKSGLAAGSAPNSLLGTIPAETPVVLLLELALPARLDSASLGHYLAQLEVAGRNDPAAIALGTAPGGAVVPRLVALLWTPRGNGSPPDVALVWSNPADEPELAAIFGGPNRLQRSQVCGHLALAHTAEGLRAIEETCQKKRPSLLNGAPAATTSLQAPLSLLLHLSAGRLLSGVLEDAVQADLNPPGDKKKAPQAIPAEINRAIELLETLPVFGFGGVLEQQRWQPLGFRS